MRRPSVADLLSRLHRWPRRLAAVTCLLLAAASAIAAHGQAPIPLRSQAASEAVVVAARDLGVGTTLTGRDLATVAWPRDLVPAGAWGEPARLVGRRLAGPLRRREAVTTARLVGGGLTTGLAAGYVATPVSIESGFATVIHAGDHVDILIGPAEGTDFATPPGRSDTSAALVAEGVTVLAVLPADAATGAGGAIVLVATDRGTALRLAALQGRQVVAVVGNPP
jgi:pilus assembly protein CpaB